MSQIRYLLHIDLLSLGNVSLLIDTACIKGSRSMPMHAAAEKSNFTDGFQRSLPSSIDVTEATNDIFKDFIGNELQRGPSVRSHTLDSGPM